MSKGITVITERDVIRDVRDRHTKQYEGYDDSHRLFGGMTVGEIRKNLASLNLETCSRDDVKSAIGGFGWADNNCDFCDQHRDLIVRLGDEPGYDARWVDICPDCLCEAVIAAELVAR